MVHRMGDKRTLTIEPVDAVIVVLIVIAFYISAAVWLVIAYLLL